MMKKLIILALTLALMLTSMTACSSSNGNSQGGTSSSQQEQAKEPELNDIVEAVKEAYGDNYLPSEPVDKEMLSDIYGVNTDNLEEFFAEMPMMSAHVDTFIAAKAVEGKGEEVQKELQAYLDDLIANSMTYPMNVAKVQSGKVVRYGDYVFFVMLGDYDDRTDVTEEDNLKFAEEQTQIGLDVIASFFA